jgi:hypothetical protein
MLARSPFQVSRSDPGAGGRNQGKHIFGFFVKTESTRDAHLLKFLDIMLDVIGEEASRNAMLSKKGFEIKLDRVVIGEEDGRVRMPCAQFAYPELVRGRPI